MRPVIKLPSRTVSPFETRNALRHLLIESIDSYCMYCESPLNVDIPVSTRVSASTIPKTFTFDDGRNFKYTEGVGPRRFGLAWVNQQLACAACVAAKGEAPGSREGFDRMRAIDRAHFNRLTGSDSGRLRLTDDAQDDLYMAALNSWVWPDESSDENGLIVLPGDDTWNLFDFKLSAQTQVEFADQGLVRLDVEERAQGWATQIQDKVWVVPNMDFINKQQDPNDLLARVRRTILGWNLNYSNPADANARDRRVDNRTAALQTANMALTNLTTLVEQVKDARNQGGDEDLEHPRVAALLGFIRETLRSVGFWTLWAKLFVHDINNAADPLWSTYSASARRLLLYQLFVEYEIDQRTLAKILTSKPENKSEDNAEEDIITQVVLSGTDLNRLPF